MKRIAQRTVSFALIIVMLTTLAFNTAFVGSAAPTSFTKVNYLQSDSRWRYLSYNNSYLQASGCGVLSIVNAIYNCTGNFIEPKTVADWAYAAKYFNQSSGGGGGMCSNNVFPKAAEVFGAQYGFTYVGGGSGTATSTTLQNHVATVGTAIVHVYGHYMCLVEYNASTGKFLVFDCAPGSGSNYNSVNRRNLTTAAGDWKTVAELSSGTTSSNKIKIDAYWLYAPTGAAPVTPVTPTVVDPDSYQFPTRALYNTSPTMTGNDVKWVQAVLVRLGYSLSVDGSFGPGTESQVKAYQNAKGLTANGRVEGDTLTQLQIDWGVIDPNHDLDLVNCVIAISCIGEVTTDSGAVIEYVESLYNALNATQKAQVSNYATLTAARATYDALNATPTQPVTPTPTPEPSSETHNVTVNAASGASFAGTSVTYNGAINLDTSRGTADGCSYANIDPNPQKPYRMTMDYYFRNTVATDPYHNSDQGVIIAMLGSGKTMGFNFATGKYFIANAGGGWNGDPSNYVVQNAGTISPGGYYRFEYVVEANKLTLIVNGTTVATANVSGAFSADQYFIFYPKHVNMDITYTKFEYLDASGTAIVGSGSAAMTSFVGMNGAGNPYVAVSDVYNVTFNTVSTHTHSLNYVAAISATCTGAGTAAYYRCIGCGKFFTDSAGNNETTFAALSIAALGHNYSTETITATCTDAGATTHTCSRCGDSYTETSGAALGHDYRATATSATCTSAGSTTYTCSRCGDSYTVTSGAALGHDYRATATSATCTSAGSTTYTCSRCGDSYTVTSGAALGHDYRATATSATCTSAGSTTYTCSRCGDSYNVAAAATGHDYRIISQSAATCTAAGSTTYRCSHCGNTYSETTAATGHDYRAVTTGATCTAAGSTTYTCSHCGDSYTVTGGEALGHNYRVTSTSATCSVAGTTVYTCSRCGDSYTVEGEVLGHNYRVTSHKDPTCTANGYDFLSCLNDASHTKFETLPALGHSFSGGVCTRCGAVDPDYATPGDFDKDGHINATDVISLMRYIVGSAGNIAYSEKADFNGDGMVNNKDVLRMMLAIANGEV